MGVTAGLGILLDTFLVRTLVVPAVFALVGDRIWRLAAIARRHAKDASGQ